MDKCAHSCQILDNIRIDEDDTETHVDDQDDDDRISYEDGDRLFVFDIDSYLENNHITINRVDHDTELNRTNYDYILKYNPNRGESKSWNDVVPTQYHDYEDIFTEKDFNKLPE